MELSSGLARVVNGEWLVAFLSPEGMYWEMIIPVNESPLNFGVRVSLYSVTDELTVEKRITHEEHKELLAALEKGKTQKERANIAYEYVVMHILSDIFFDLTGGNE